jgi:hypothetical protein
MEKQQTHNPSPVYLGQPYAGFCGFPAGGIAPAPAPVASAFDADQRQALVQLALIQPRIYQRLRPTYQQLLEMPDAELVAAAGFTPTCSAEQALQQLPAPVATGRVMMQQPTRMQRAAFILVLGTGPAPRHTSAELTAFTDRQLVRAAGIEPMWPVTLEPEALAALEQLSSELQAGLMDPEAFRHYSNIGRL